MDVYKKVIKCLDAIGVEYDSFCIPKTHEDSYEPEEHTVYFSKDGYFVSFVFHEDSLENLIFDSFSIEEDK